MLAIKYSQRVRDESVTRHEKKMSIFTGTSQFCQTPSNKGLLTIVICCADTFFHNEMECWGWAEWYCSAASALMESVRRESVMSLDLQHIIHYRVLTHVTWWDRSQITHIDIYAALCFACRIVQNARKMRTVWHLRLQDEVHLRRLVYFYNTHLKLIHKYKLSVRVCHHAAY